MKKQEVEEVEQAISAVKKEEIQKQSYNRFKDLQKRFAKQFMYHRNQHYGQNKVKVQCKITYIPFEARLDRTSFELMIRETKPQNLILLNATEKQT